MKVSVYVAASLDGFIAREDGGLDWLPGSEEEVDSEDYGFADFFNSIDALVMGRHTFDFVLATGLWPYGEKPVYVWTSRPLDTGELPNRNIIPFSGTPDELHQRLVDDGLEHVYLDGGKAIQSFMREGFVNAIIITWIPVLIGSGIPLFGDLEKDVNLDHVKTQVFESGMVQSRYAIRS